MWLSYYVTDPIRPSFRGDVANSITDAICQSECDYWQGSRLLGCPWPNVNFQCITTHYRKSPNSEYEDILLRSLQ